MESLNYLKKGFYKKSRKGKILKLIREKYLRDDITCGYLLKQQINEVNLLFLNSIQSFLTSFSRII